MCTSGHGLNTADCAFNCVQGVPFREEDKMVLRDAQSQLRHRVASFVREHKDHYVRRTPLAKAFGHQLCSMLHDNASEHATQHNIHALHLLRLSLVRFPCSFVSAAYVQGAFLDDGLILEEMQRAANRKP